MMWWPFIVLSWNILCRFVFGVPVAQISYSQLPQMPSGIQYIGNIPLPGGIQQSLLTANFTPNQIVTSSGIATNPFDVGLPATFDFFGSGIVDAGRGIGSAVSSLLGKVGLGVSTLVSGLLGMGGMNTNAYTYSVPIGSNSNTPTSSPTQTAQPSQTGTQTT
ncbi:uncharacterized protein LOC129567399 [Sitodiplosis mosellana]|uniref:uncharacterized protein LOC129567399 n=1 Tax=Sitodiplosis mosellana TaxID=263140 RepID=UPI00244432CC|nr:uncharacterized protein LOC129567399 [Sitodiplosis mosellana]